VALVQVRTTGEERRRLASVLVGTRVEFEEDRPGLHAAVVRAISAW
jgi:hypothetical protein